MNNRALCLAGLLTLSAVARAGTCEDSFQAMGDPRNGLLFTGEVQMPGLSVSSAFGQLQQIALSKGYELGNESIVGDTGELLFTQTNLRTPIVMRAQADGSGKVSLGTKLAKGQQVEIEDARQEICSILAVLKTGKQGEAIAAAARQKTGVGQVIDAEAPKLSAEIDRDIKKTMAGVASKGTLGNLLVGSENYATAGEVNAAFAPIVARYKGRNYRIDGQIYTMSRNEFSGEMLINYLVTQTRGLLRIRQRSTYNSNNFMIACRLAPDQEKFFLTLAQGDWVKLAGTVDQISTQGMELQDCRQAN
ncbi:MAG TPA: hypothetical protein VIU34_09070 [Steroidobacter sp.]